MKIQLVEIKVWNGTAEVTLRYSTHAYVTWRSDTPADTPYAARISQPITLKRSAVAEDATRGESSLSIGAVDLENEDGELDVIATYAYAGRTIRVLLVEAGAALASAVVLFEGILEQPQFEWGTGVVRIVVRDKAFDLTKPVQSAVYGGTNALPDGIDGIDDLAGKYKPVLFGYAARLAPPSVNTARLIYQVSAGAIADVPAVYDRGLALGRGANYASLADMQTTAPASTQYRVWPAGGMFRLGSTPAGQILCDALEGATAAARYPGAIARRVLLAAGVALSDIDTAALDALDVACPWECGYWATHSQAVAARTVLDALMQSTGGWWAATKSNRIAAGILAAPAGTPVAELHAGNVLDLARRRSKDDDRGIPPWRVFVGYARYWDPQSSDFAGAVTQAMKDDLSQEYRLAIAEDAAVRSAYPAAPEVRMDTLLRYKADAQAMATARHAVLKTRRDTLQVDVRSTAAANADLGQTVRVKLERYGLDAGRLFIVIGSDLDARIDAATLTLWG